MEDDTVKVLFRDKTSNCKTHLTYISMTAATFYSIIEVDDTFFFTVNSGSLERENTDASEGRVPGMEKRWEPHSKALPKGRPCSPKSLFPCMA